MEEYYIVLNTDIYISLQQKSDTNRNGDIFYNQGKESAGSFSKDHSEKVHLLEQYRWRILFVFDLLFGGVTVVASDQFG